MCSQNNITYTHTYTQVAEEFNLFCLGKHSLFSGPVDESGKLNGEQYLIHLPQDSLKFIRSGPTSGEYLPLYII